jgi:hypothetical protein
MTRGLETRDNSMASGARVTHVGINEEREKREEERPFEKSGKEAPRAKRAPGNRPAAAPSGASLL